MKNRYIGILALTVAVALGAALSVQLSAVTAQAEHPEGSKCQMMAQKMDEMKEKKAQMGEKLSSQLQQMKAAEGDAKVAAMADVIETMIQQRKEMMGMHQNMCQNMMGHMGGHMEMSMNDDGRKKMQKCPMMQKMKEGSGGMHGRGTKAKTAA